MVGTWMYVLFAGTEAAKQRGYLCLHLCVDLVMTFCICLFNSSISPCSAWLSFMVHLQMYLFHHI